MALVLKAFVDEENCIGCSKCIRTCPTDAIVGAKYMLHTIIPELCTVCENCITACPTNCIILKTPGAILSPECEAMLVDRKQHRLNQRRMATNGIQLQYLKEEQGVKVQRKQQIADAIARVKMRKMQRS